MAVRVCVSDKPIIPLGGIKRAAEAGFVEPGQWSRHDAEEALRALGAGPLAQAMIPVLPDGVVGVGRRAVKAVNETLDTLAGPDRELAEPILRVLGVNPDTRFEVPDPDTQQAQLAWLNNTVRIGDTISSSL